jgi:hypothetical protein
LTPLRLSVAAVVLVSGPPLLIWATLESVPPANVSVLIGFVASPIASPVRLSDAPERFSVLVPPPSLTPAPRLTVPPVRLSVPEVAAPAPRLPRTVVAATVKVPPLTLSVPLPMPSESSARPTVSVCTLTFPAVIVNVPVAVLPEASLFQPRTSSSKVAVTLPPVKLTVPVGLAVPLLDL